ncbi:hypothetical protein [Albimonas pacifica]|uniref:Uncharacterized protein n=1 Tax=Albimonas pacifica TaxID=1114924 RepID=A0A1I3JIR6_9RHOB|nr:hypothetical protein [Albimonas pacifica]SFI60137.1 hypothetical protein SAMN05216258_10825 [Albimonas pacifica]
MTHLGISPDGDGFKVEELTWTEIARFARREDAELFVSAKHGGRPLDPVRMVPTSMLTPEQLGQLDDAPEPDLEVEPRWWPRGGELSGGSA